MSYHREQKLRKRYNMTIEQFDAIKADQGDKCPICREREATVVDHCHTNGHVRGLLCKQCNGAIGMLRDDPINMLRAVEYLLLDVAVEG